MKQTYFLLMIIVPFLVFSQDDKIRIIDTVGVEFKYNLPNELHEISGGATFEGFLYALNDGGNAPVIYKLNKENGKIIQEIEIVNAVNNDWEALTIDWQTGRLFIADLGNNRYGNRKDLVVYIVDLCVISEKDYFTRAVAKKINVYYPEQKDFTRKKRDQINFDCEAMYFFEDNLYFLTKEWGTRNTKLYMTPAVVGKWAMLKLNDFPVDALITDAVSMGNRVVMTGYNTQEEIFVFHGKMGPDGFKFVRKYYLGRADEYGQIETIFDIEKDVYIAGEKWKELPAGVLKINNFFEHY